MMSMFILLITGYREIGLKLQRSDVCQYSNTVFPFGWEILIFPTECYGLSCHSLVNRQLFRIIILIWLIGLGEGLDRI